MLVAAGDGGADRARGADGEPCLRRARRRPSVAYRTAHLPGARSVPLSELEGRLGEIPRAGRVVLYGESILEASEAYARLRDRGYRNAGVLEDGFAGRIKAELPGREIGTRPIDCARPSGSRIVAASGPFSSGTCTPARRPRGAGDRVGTHPGKERLMAPSRKSGLPRSLQPARSPKAGRPAEEVVMPARVRRRAKTAHGAVRKGTTLFEAARGPRVLWGRTKPKVKKG